MKRKKESGFTLLEILVVISLIVIIVGIALPRFTGVTDEGRKAKASGELKTVQTAIESYLLNTSSSVPGTTWATMGTALEGASPRLVGETSKLYDPFGTTSTTNYSFAKSANGKYYVLWSLGVDKANTITSIDNAGDIQPAVIGDDIYASNGQIQ